MALNYAIDHPDKVKALVLIAAQYKMPKKLLKVQNMLFHLMPNSTFNKMGVKKTDHEANIEAPEELAIVLQRFYDNIR